MNEEKACFADRENSLESYNIYLKNSGFNKTLEELVESIAKRKVTPVVLDIGCGNAGALNELKKLFGGKVIVKGIDLMPAEKKIDEFIQGSIIEEPLPRENDLVVSFRVLHEVGNIEKALSKIAECLAPLGKAVLSIRCQGFEGNKVKFLGRMTNQDLEFLQKITKKKRFNGVKVKGKEARISMTGLFFDQKTKNSAPGKLGFVSGFGVLLEK